MPTQVQDFLLAVAGILFFIGFYPYGKAIWKTRHLPSRAPGKAEPKKSTWIVWVALDWVLFGGMYMEDALNLQIVGCCIGATITLGLALIYGDPKWKLMDKLCLLGAGIGFSLMWVSAEVGILATCAVALIGSIPTFIEAWKYPDAEDTTAWIIFFTSCVIELVALKKWTFADAAQPVTFFALESGMMILMLVQRIQRKRALAV